MNHVLIRLSEHKWKCWTAVNWLQLLICFGLKGFQNVQHMSALGMWTSYGIYYLSGLITQTLVTRVSSGPQSLHTECCQKVKDNKTAVFIHVAPFRGGKAAAAAAGATQILFEAVNSGCAVWLWLVSFHFRASQHSLRISEILTQHQKQHENCSWPGILQPFVTANFSSNGFPKKRKQNPTTNRRAAAQPKFLCLSNQSGDWEERRGAAAGSSTQAGTTLGVLFIVSPTWRKDIKWNSSEKRKRTGSCLTEGGNRQLAASFGSGGCQRPGEMVETGSGLKRRGGGLRLKRPSSI